MAMQERDIQIRKEKHRIRRERRDREFQYSVAASVAGPDAGTTASLANYERVLEAMDKEGYPDGSQTLTDQGHLYESDPPAAWGLRESEETMQYSYPDVLIFSAPILTSAVTVEPRAKYTGKEDIRISRIQRRKVKFAPKEIVTF